MGKVVLVFILVATFKISKVKAFRSGIVRARVLLKKNFKLQVPGVTKQRKTNFFSRLSVLNASQHWLKKLGYIFSGNQLEGTSGQIAFGDHMESFSTKAQKK